MVRGIEDNEGMKMKKVYIINEEKKNEFEKGRKKENDEVEEKKGIIKWIQKEEVEGVMEKEMEKVKKREKMKMKIVEKIEGEI